MPSPASLSAVAPSLAARLTPAQRAAVEAAAAAFAVALLRSAR